jgi:hypothetical protein
MMGRVGDARLVAAASAEDIENIQSPGSATATPQQSASALLVQELLACQTAATHASLTSTHPYLYGASSGCHLWNHSSKKRSSLTAAQQLRHAPASPDGSELLRVMWRSSRGPRASSMLPLRVPAAAAVLLSVPAAAPVSC